MGLGFSFEDVVTMCTANPAKAVGEQDRIGSLKVGMQADISVLEEKEGDWVVYDILRAPLKVDKCLVPALTVKRGEVFEPEWGPRAWGWEPDPA